MQMTETQAVPDYVKEVVEQFSSGQAREHGYRPALERLMRSFDDVGATNDPKRSAHGNPDMIFWKKSNHDIILGYAEAKDITIDLDKTAESEQLHRYAGYNKLFLTNYLEFRFFKNGEEYERIEIGKLHDGKIDLNAQEYIRLENELQAFLASAPEPIKSGKRLAIIMGQRARRIRDNVVRYLMEDNDRNQELEKIYQLMKESLVHDLTKEKFADMYAQTLVYGLFAARYSDSTPDDFTRREASELVPASNPFLREFFAHIGGIHFDKRLAHIVDELCAVFAVSNVHLLIQKHLRLFEVDNDKDPIIHFYEDFLKEYDPQERKRMGAYYTPVPIVRFIVRQVDRILIKDFGLLQGLADTSKVVKEIDHGQVLQIRNLKTGRIEKTSIEKRELHKVQVLDPAVGTATFLNEIVKFIAKKFDGQEGRWSSYVNDELLPRLSGFELMMAPYTIAHLKLSMTLQETGVVDLNRRLGVYLTNTLEEGIPRQQDLFSSLGLAAVVTEESQAASEIKHERPIMVVLGNPPYSGHSSNNTEYANNLVKKYKFEPDGIIKLQERNSKWLNDDYVKFIAFAEDMIEKTGEGIMAMITNNGYLDNPTFRGMRWRLTRTFDRIYILDLHGNAKKKETSPDGSKDENVFDIQQGVSIILGIRLPSSERRSRSNPEVYRIDMWGSRKSKFDHLNKDIEESDWGEPIVLTDPLWLFTKGRNQESELEYSAFIPLDMLFLKNSLGFQTHRDNFAICDSILEVRERLDDMLSLDSDELIREKYALKDNRDWQLSEARERLRNQQTDKEFDQSITECVYRPFDIKFTYLDEVFSDYPRTLFKKHLLNKKNLSLGIGRQGLAVGEIEWCLATVAEYPVDANIFRRGGINIFPLYLYDAEGSKHPNFNRLHLETFLIRVDEKPTPEEILDYIYAILHSPSYRSKYKEFLKTDFPRIPPPSGNVEFLKLADFGHRLRELHLMKSSIIDDYHTTFPKPGTNEIAKINFDEGNVWINNTQYFGNVPELAWNFYIGGYQPAQKWLKDRKGRRLTNRDIEHYQKIVIVLIETKKLMDQIDE
jgi:type I restriction-modification system DNA methylase subunit